MTIAGVTVRPGDLLYIEVPLHTGQSFQQQRYAWSLWYHEHLYLYSPMALAALVWPNQPPRCTMTSG